LDFLSLDYRDPLYGIVLLFVIVIMVRISDYSARYFKQKDEDENIKKFINAYESSSNSLEYKDMILRKDLPLESVILMAMSYDKTGEYDKSIKIYSTLLENLREYKDNGKKRNILVLLGKTYYKAGFLYKARDIFLMVLGLQPKNIDALTYLVSIYESLREYNNAIETLNILEKVKGDVADKKLYFKALSILHDNTLTDQQKVSHIIKLGLEKNIVQRKLFEFATNKGLKLPPDILHKFNYENLIDLIWDHDKKLFSEEFIQNNKLLKEIYSAKNIDNYVDKSEIFELDTLLKLKKLDDFSMDLSFSYTCDNCKNIFPLYIYRCPVCKNIDSAKVDISLTRREYETGSFV